MSSTGADEIGRKSSPRNSRWPSRSPVSPPGRPGPFRPCSSRFSRCTGGRAAPPPVDVEWLAHGYRYLARPRDAAARRRRGPAARLRPAGGHGHHGRDRRGERRRRRRPARAHRARRGRRPERAARRPEPDGPPVDRAPAAYTGTPPSMRVQLLISGVAAPSGRPGPARPARPTASSPRGAILAQQRVAHRRARPAGRRIRRGRPHATALISSLRRVRRRLDRDRLP